MNRITQRKGDIAKAQAISTFTKLGYDVSVLLTESAPYDIILDDGNRLYKVQVKFSGAETGLVDLRRIHSNSQGYVVQEYKANEYDWLYIYRQKENKEYLIKYFLNQKRYNSLR